MSAWLLYETMGPGAGQTADNPAATSGTPAATPSQLVEVNFVTEPFEAKIYLDGELLRDPAQNPYTTPCTIEVPARTCRVAFQYDDEPRWDAGSYDLGRMQQIVSSRPHSR